MASDNHRSDYHDIDFRAYPEKYRIGRGEQGVLMAEPYKSEILPYWKFKTPAIAETSAKKIFEMFNNYKESNDFVGMDMARKFLQMGFTRSRRYANHPSGHKYSQDGKVSAQAADAMTSDKAKSAAIFYSYYEKAKNDAKYLELKTSHKDEYENPRKD